MILFSFFIFLKNFNKYYFNIYFLNLFFININSNKNFKFK